MDHIQIAGLKIPGKRGPYSLRMLDYDEAFELLFNSPDDKTPLLLRLVQRCLVNGKGENVYTANQIDKIKKDIVPGPKLMKIGMAAYKLNEIDDLSQIDTKTEAAEKN